MNLAIEMLEFLMKYSVHTVQPSVILTQVHFTILAVFEISSVIFEPGDYVLALAFTTKTKNSIL